MEKLLNIPAKSMLNREIPLNRLYLEDLEEMQIIVDNIKWVAIIKPQVNDVTAVVTDQKLYEEIHLIEVQATDPSNPYDICIPIFKQIRYPTLICISYQNKRMFAVCNFHPGMNRPDDNILGSVLFSHWIYPELLSDGASRFLQELNQALIPQGSLEDIYRHICDAVLNFRVSGIMQGMISKMLYDMTGKKSVSHFLDNCTPYTRYNPKDQSVRARYEKRDRTKTGSRHYDTEDLWYAFRTNEKTRKILAGRGYRDMDEMIVRIMEKYDSLSPY